MRREVRRDEPGEGRVWRASILVIALTNGCGSRDSLTTWPSSTIPSNDAPPSPGSDGGNTMNRARDAGPREPYQAPSASLGSDFDGQSDVDAPIEVNLTYFTYWTQAIADWDAGGEMVSCSPCLFGPLCHYPSDGDCRAGSGCVVQHCPGSKDGSALWSCIESCFPVNSPCLDRWTEYMACAVDQCANACR